MSGEKEVRTSFSGQATEEDGNMERYRLHDTDRPVDPSYLLPCDVTLGGETPHVTIQQGCKLQTLITALLVREKARRSVADVITREVGREI
jgi:hypothetical protein